MGWVVREGVVGRVIGVLSGGSDMRRGWDDFSGGGVGVRLSGDVDGGLVIEGGGGGLRGVDF